NATTLEGEGLAGLGSVGRTGDATQCDDNAHNIPASPCGSLTIDVPQPGRLLVVMSGDADGVALDDTTGPGATDDSTTKANGRCVVLLDGKGPITGVPVDLRDTGLHSFAVPVVSDSLTAGSHTVSAVCNEFDGDLDYTVTLTAMTLSAN